MTINIHGGNMDKKSLKKMEDKLIKKKNEILETIEREEQGEISDRESENVIGDIVDTANSAYEYQIYDRLSENERKKLHEINEALKRIDEGVYGKCIVCGKKIEEKRLIVIPEAKKCIMCKMAEERKKF